jgi:hypothetical protein
MIFSSKKGRAGLLRRKPATADTASADSLDALSAEIEALTGGERDPGSEVARRLLDLRYRAGLKLIEPEQGELPSFAEPDFEALGSSSIPEAGVRELTPGLLRAAMLRSGCLLVRGLVDPEEAARLAREVDRAYEARESQEGGSAAGGAYFEDFEPDPRFGIALERAIVRGGAGLLAADSPEVMRQVLEAFERAGLREVVTGYLGERSAISVNKCLLRKVSPDLFAASTKPGEAKPSAWHQDGAFLGDVRAVNVWLSLSRCGDEAPGLDVVPQRLDGIVATGTEGAAFEWSVSRAVAEEVAGDTGILRPIFDPGDALLFDELFLHSTAAEPEMPSMRYAVESWFFGRSGFPEKYAPLAF